jgi:glycosyltransferase involved in cell wall biosynthesis
VRRARHLRPDPFQRWLFRRTFGVALCHAGLETRASRLVAGSGAAIRVLPPAVPRGFTPVHGREPTRVRLGVPAAVTVVGTVGKLDRRRDQDLVHHALAAAPGVWGVLVGSGAHRAALERVAARFGVADRVVFTGFVGDGLADLLAARPALTAAGSTTATGRSSSAACGAPTLTPTCPSRRSGAVRRAGAVPPTRRRCRPGAWAADAPRRERRRALTASG